jgi:uroporphyrinogen decarboxylase
MTYEERLLRTIRKQKVKGIPVCFRFADGETEKMLAEKLSMDLEELQKLVDSDIKHCYVLEDLQMYLGDNKLIEFAIKTGFAEKRDEENIIYDRWGVGWALNNFGQRPVKSPFKSLKNIMDFRLPKVDMVGQFFLVDKNLNQYKKNGYAVIIPQYYSLFEKTWLLMGYENFMIGCYKDRKIIEILLDIITEYRVEMAQKIVDFKVTCGHTGDDFGTQRGPVMSLEFWRQLFKPRLKKIWAVYKKNNIPVIHHCCGDCRVFIDDMIEIGLDVLHPVQASAMPIKELKKNYGDRITFYGGIDCQEILTTGTPNDVRKNVNDTVSILGENGGLILSPINVMSNVPVDNLKALIETVNMYR